MHFLKTVGHNHMLQVTVTDELQKIFTINYVFINYLMEYLSIKILENIVRGI